MNHPVAGGDHDTMVFFSEEMFEEIDDGAGDLPLAAPVTPRMQLLHRRLLAAARTPHEAMQVEEIALELISSGLTYVEPKRSAANRPSTRTARRLLVEDARLLLATDPAIATVTELARRLHCSPHHLSRTFSSVTGVSLSTYRTWLKLNLALECIVENRLPLADVATQCGFADHGHLTRTIRRHTGDTPTRLRALLANLDPTPGLQKI